MMVGKSSARQTRRKRRGFLTGNKDEFPHSYHAMPILASCMNELVDFELRSVPVTCEWVSEDGRFMR